MFYPAGDFPPLHHTFHYRLRIECEDMQDSNTVMWKLLMDAIKELHIEVAAAEAAINPNILGGT